MKKGQWIIDNRDNKYYQLAEIQGALFALKRKGEIALFTQYEIDNCFRLATSDEVIKHLMFLIKTGQSNNLVPMDGVETAKREEKKSKSFKELDFYMVTVRGLNGAEKRHTSYNDAVKEAYRLAKQENHTAWVVGVVAKVEPVIDVKIIEE